MAFRRTYRRRNFRRRTGGRTRKFGYADMAKKVWRDVKYLKSIVNVEFKRIDLDSGQFSPLDLGGPPTPILMTGTVQGDGPSNRDGNSIRLKSLYMKVHMERDATATKPHTRYRWMIVKSVYNNNALPGLGDILAQTTNYMSPLNVDESTGYKVLLDRSYTVTADHPSQEAKFYLKLGHHAKYSSTTAAIGDTTSGHLFLIVFVDDNTNNDFAQYNTRIRFVDN